ncbi:MAG: 3'-5' exonuclease, partial [Planctomycetota bacterium]
TVLRGVLEPGSRHVRAAAATVVWGCTASELRLANDNDAQWSELIDQLGHARRIWHERGVGAALHHVFVERTTFARLATLRHAERRITNLRHLAELLALREAEPGVSPERLLRWLTDHRSQDGNERELRLESDAAKIRVMTVHRSKGLEFPVVMLPTLWLDAPRPASNTSAVVVPDAAGWTLHLDPATIDLKSWLRFEIGESARHLYVALTRAQARCGLVWASGKTTDRKGTPHKSVAAPSLRAVALSGLGWQLLAPTKGGAAANDWLRQVWLEADKTGKDIEPRLAELAEEAKAALTMWASACGASLEEITIVPQLQPLAVCTATQSTAPTAQTLADNAVARINNRWRTTSFTNLVRGAEVPQTLRDPEVRDPASDSEAGPLIGFAAGADAGDALHDVLERWDPALEPDPTTIANALTEFGLGQGSPRHAPGCVPAERASALLRMLARAPMPTGHGQPFVLATSTSVSRCPEWGFHLPLDHLCAADIATAIQTHDPDLHRRCGAALALLGNRSVHGFLKGFVDLVVRHDGRWYVIDWKSNRLGTHPSDYTDDRLWEAMAHSHYAVQAVLYLVALHRWLRVSVSDYAPQQHLGGAWYVFLRGLSANSSQGVLTLQPRLALIHALDQRIGGVP